MEFGIAKSSIESVCDVPCLSILGPLLHIINVNYICNVLNIF